MSLGRAFSPALFLKRAGGCVPGRVASPAVGEGLVFIVLGGTRQAEGCDTQKSSPNALELMAR